jgi:protein-S-isoprenylcysteine O-methyltransferase Ste14
LADKKTLVRALIFTVLAPGTFTVLVPLLIYAPSPGMAERLGAARYLGGLLIAVGVLGYLWSAAEFLLRGAGTPAPWFSKRLRFLIGEEPQALVQTSIYRYVRNPMYVSVVSILLGEALLFASARLLAYTAIGWLICHCEAVFLEEPHLRRTRGDSFERYCREVPRWIPRLRDSRAK